MRAHDRVWLFLALLLAFAVGVGAGLRVAAPGAAVLALAGAGAWASVQKVARQVRPLVDEPDDYIVVTLDGIGEWLLHRQLDEVYISKLLTATVDAIVGRREVTKEVTLGDTTK